MPSSFPPIALVIVLALALLVSRPWLDARRPIMSLALLLGVAVGRAGARLVPDELLAQMTPVAALCAGWIALISAESWDGPGLRRTRSGLRILWLVVPSLLLGWWLAAITLACAVIALDPDAVREGLRHMSRPSAMARQAPTVAGLALGLALIASCLADVRGPLAGVAALPLGIACGLGYAGLLRLAEGKAFVLTLLITMPILCSGIAHALGLSPLAAVFCAGVVLTQDGARRDLIFSTLREYERPVMAGLLLLGGAGMPLVGSFIASWPFWAGVGILMVIRPLAWLLVGSGLTWRQALPLSPLMIPLAVAGPAGWIAGAVGLAFIPCELLSRIPEQPPS